MGALVFFFSGQALAHRVMVFAWVEGDQVFGECKFSGGNRAKNAQILVRDDQGKELLHTRTDDNGEFSYTIPEKTTMHIELIAGMGHKGEWKIPLEELADAPVPTSAAAPPQEKEPGTSVTEAAPGLNDARLEAMVERAVETALNRKLTPVMKILADIKEKGPSVNDVMGGVGYIFGLVGVAAYLKSRKT
jgi:nickel transport protein